jgi:hypothetical protein
MNEATRSRLLLLAMLLLAAALVTIPACVAMKQNTVADLPPTPPAFAERTVQRYAVQMPPEVVQVPVTNLVKWDFDLGNDPSQYEFLLRTGSVDMPVSEWPVEMVVTGALSVQRVSLSGTLQLLTLTVRDRMSGWESGYATKP